MRFNDQELSEMQLAKTWHGNACSQQPHGLLWLAMAKLGLAATQVTCTPGRVFEAASTGSPGDGCECPHYPTLSHINTLYIYLCILYMHC